MKRAPHERGNAIAGFSIGLLVLDTRHRLVPGNLQNANSFSFPVLYEVVRGVTGSALMSGASDAAEPIVAAAQNLAAQGVSVVAGACGSFANFQTAVAAAVDVPVYMSILLEVPLILRALPAERKLGIIFASAATFTERVRKECGISSTRQIVAVGAESIPCFQAILRQEGDFEDEELERGVTELGLRTLEEHPQISAWLIQCSDLPPYSRALARATRLPVFDMVGMVERIHRALAPHEYAE